MKYGNLHLHSNHSDGAFRPAYLVRIAKSLGYKGIALTDHDTLAGIPELFREAEKEGMEAMSGVEYYGLVRGKNFHFVGLDFDPNHPSIVAFSKKMNNYRNEHTRAQFEDAVARGVLQGITWDDVVKYHPGIDWFCNEQVFNTLDIMGMLPYGSDREDMWQAIFKSGKSGKVHLPKPNAEEVIQVIHEAGGIALLAHPPQKAFDEGYVDDMIAMGLDGIEVCHPDLNEQETKLACYTAVKHNLYCSGGTDHTGVLSGCDDIYAIPAYQGVTLDEFRAIKERRFR